MHGVTATVTVLAGPAGSGKTERLLALYRTALASRPPGAVLWLAPTHRAATDAKRRLLSADLSACFAPQVFTFEDFATAILQSAEQPIHPLSALMKRQLVARLIRQAHREGRLAHFASIAETSGLVDLVCEFISELKRREIWPEHLAAFSVRAKERELAQLYAEYQALLQQYALYDAEGRFWSARFRLREGQTRPFEKLSLVVADGFADFTHTQHEILELLGQRTEQIWISLPLEPASLRGELFGKSDETRRLLAERHPQLQVEYLARPSLPEWPALAHLETELFKNPRVQQPAATTEHLEIVAAASDLAELEMIGRRIKDLLVRGDRERSGHGVRPRDIVVVFRSLSAAAPLAAEVFTRLGIPHRLEFGPELEHSLALRRLLAWLELSEDDWPFRPLLAALGSNCFSPVWPEWKGASTRLATEHLLHVLGIPRGRERILALAARRVPAAARSATGDNSATGDHSATGDPSATSSDSPGPLPIKFLDPEAGAPSAAARNEHPAVVAQREREAGWAIEAVPILERVSAMLAALPAEGTLDEWWQALVTLATESGWLAVVENGSQPLDREAWRRLEAAIAALRELDLRLNLPEHRHSRAEFLMRMHDLLRYERLPASGDEHGSVRILSAQSIRGLAIPYLFVAGLSEKAFPPAEREDRLYTEAEAGDLISQGLQLPQRHERQRDEMLLFYEVLTRARRRLTLSYAALDEKAQPLLPSPYLLEVESACGYDSAGQSRIQRTELLLLSPVFRDPSAFDSLPTSGDEWRLSATSAALSGEPAALASLEQQASAPEAFRNLVQGLLVDEERANRFAFGRHEGIVTSPAAQAALAERFVGKHWNAHQLETFAHCPFQFYAQHVLKLEPLEEIELQTDYLRLGSLLHDTLATLHRQLNAAIRDAFPEGLPDDFIQQYEATLDHLLSELHLEDDLAQALAEIDREQLKAWGQRYVAQFDAYHQDKKSPNFWPRHFEVSFGMPAAAIAADDPISTPQPLVLGEGAEQVKIAGRIDRIDLAIAGDRPVFNIVDYKTGSSARYTSKNLETGQALQLPLYAIAAEELLLRPQAAQGWRAGYWFIKGKGFQGKSLQLSADSQGTIEPTEKWQWLRAQLTELVLAIVAAVRSGQFPVFSPDLDCTGTCPYHTVCRIHQIRALEKTWHPTLARR